MDSSQLSVIYNSLPDFGQLGCPIEVKTYSLARDKQTGDIFLNFSLINTSHSLVEAFRIFVYCYDSFNESIDRNLEPITIKLQDLSFKARSEFDLYNWYSLVSRKETRRVKILFDKILFENGEIWAKKDEEISKLITTPIPPQDKKELLQSIAGKDAIVFSISNDINWICTCGKVNANISFICNRCGRNKENVLTLLSYEGIEQLIHNRVQEENRIRSLKNEKERELKEKNEQIRKKLLADKLEAEENRKKAENIRLEELRIKGLQELKIQNKKTILGLLLFIIIVTIIVSAVYMIDKYQKYYSAQKLVESKKYEQAIEIFVELPAFINWHDDYINAYFSFTYSEFAKNNYEYAFRLYDIAFSNEIFEKLRPDIRFMQGLCYEKDKQYQLALKYYKYCQEMSSDYVNGINKKSISKVIEDLKNAIPEIKAQNLTDANILINDITAAINNGDVETASIHYDKLLLICEDHKKSFSIELITKSEIISFRNSISVKEKENEISKSLILYDESMSSGSYTRAIQYLEIINNKNKECISKYSTTLIDENEISNKYNLAARKILDSITTDSLNTNLVEHAYIKTGEYYDGGKKTNVIPKGSSFGLKYYGINTKMKTRVKMFKVDMNMFDVVPKEVLVFTGEPSREANGLYYCEKENNDYQTGLYCAVLQFINEANMEVEIGRFYFTIK